MSRSVYKFVDIHHHLIYGLDDGAQTWEQTQQMLERAWQNKIHRIIATPHAEPGLKPFPMQEFTERMEQARAVVTGDGGVVDREDGAIEERAVAGEDGAAKELATVAEEDRGGGRRRRVSRGARGGGRRRPRRAAVAGED